jgi:inner membrane protein
VASLISHAVAALGIGASFYKPGIAKRVWVLGAVCSVLPDADVVGFHFGVRYGDFWGHRGFTHSLLFAAILATLFALFAVGGISSGDRRLIWVYLFLATASHGLLDAMTNGGLGVAFFSPFDTTRYFLAWRPILVSPIGVTRFFSPRGLAVLRTEVLWIWFPTGLLASFAFVLRLARTPQPRK